MTPGEQLRKCTAGRTCTITSRKAVDDAKTLDGSRTISGSALDGTTSAIDRKATCANMAARVVTC